MIENNERGKQARKYFIACEEHKHELSRKELALMVIQAEEEKERLQMENKHTKALLEQKQEQLDESKEWFSIKRYAKENVKLEKNKLAGIESFVFRTWI